MVKGPWTVTASLCSAHWGDLLKFSMHDDPSGPKYHLENWTFQYRSSFGMLPYRDPSIYREYLLWCLEYSNDCAQGYGFLVKISIIRSRKLGVRLGIGLGSCAGSNLEVQGIYNWVLTLLIRQF